MGIGTRQREFEDIPAGEYEVKFNGYMHYDSEMLPQMKLGADDTFVVRYRTQQLDGKDGPVGSFDPLNELKLFVRAFGGDVDVIPEHYGYDDVPELLAAVELTMEATTKAVVKKENWISYLEGMSIPPGPTLVRFGGITSVHEGKPGWMEGQWGPYVWGNLVAASGKYKGCQAKFGLAYPIQVDAEADPPEAYLETRQDTGNFTKAAARWKKLQTTFCGPLNEFDMEGVKDIYNICPEVQEAALQKAVVAQVEINEAGFADLDTLMNLPEGMSLPDDVNEEPEQAPAAEPSGNNLQVARVGLRQAISRQVQLHSGDGSAVAWKNADDINDWSLTNLGVAWAKEVLVPICEESGLTRTFSDYDEGQIIYLLRLWGYDQLADRVNEGQEAGGDF